MESYHNTAIVFGNLKEALLHFEHVIPMNLTGQFMGLRPANASAEKFKDPEMADYRELLETLARPDVLLSLYPPRLRTIPAFKQATNVFDGALFSHMVRNAYGDDAYRSYVDSLSAIVGRNGATGPQISCPSITSLRALFGMIVQNFSLSDIPIDSSAFMLGIDENLEPLHHVHVSQIKMIDTEKITLPLILEFRKDETVMKKMRNFRLFAYQQYQGKDRAFVEDDIHKRLDDYEAAIKSSGFETRMKVLSFVLESKFLLGAAATSAVSLLLGSPQVAIGAISTGAVVEIGRFSLQCAKERNALAQICSGNPVSYIADVKKLHSP